MATLCLTAQCLGARLDTPMLVSFRCLMLDWRSFRVVQNRLDKERRNTPFVKSLRRSEASPCSLPPLVVSQKFAPAHFVSFYIAFIFAMFHLEKRTCKQMNAWLMQPKYYMSGTVDQCAHWVFLEAKAAKSPVYSIFDYEAASARGRRCQRWLAKLSSKSKHKLRRRR